MHRDEASSTPTRPHLASIPMAPSMLVVAIVATISTGHPEPPVELSRSTRDAIEALPTVPLDGRVNRERMTTLAPPPVETTIVRPVAAEHRIATDRGQTDLDEQSWTTARASLRRGLLWLQNRQSVRGGWMEGTAVLPTDQPPREAAAAIAVTAMGVKAMAQTPDDDFEETRNRGLEFVVRSIDARGIEGLATGGLGNYVASAVTMGLAAVGTDSPASRPLMTKTVEYLKSGQWNQTKGVAPSQDWFGGAGYGRHGRPDLSNTQMMLDALYDAGVSPSEPVVQRALVFLGRTQNHKATNPAPWAQSGSDDGGFIYTPANGGESFGSQAAGEGRYGETMPAGAPRSLRSYGSMTYAGFKSLLYAGLSSDDPRVIAALGWIRRHWTFDENPGLGQQGLYYYLHAMARALRASGIDVITTADGTDHDWRRELIAAIETRQNPDGSWKNPVDRWEESRPELATIYATLALQEALKPTVEIE